MTERYKSFLVALEKPIRDDDAESIMKALHMIKGVARVEPHVLKGEDYVMYRNGYYAAKKEMYDCLEKEKEWPK
jgi:hypothetical protein